MQGENRRASAVVRAATATGWSGSRVEDAWDDESVVRWRVDVDVQPADELPFAARCELGLLGAYAVTAGEQVTVVYAVGPEGRVYIVEVEDQRREAVNQWLAAHGRRAAGAVREVVKTDERGPRGIRFQLVYDFPGIVTLTRSKWRARRTWPGHATIGRVGDPALLIYEPTDPDRHSVVLSDWTGRCDLAALERRWLNRRQLLATRPAIYTPCPGVRCRRTRRLPASCPPPKENPLGYRQRSFTWSG